MLAQTETTTHAAALPLLLVTTAHTSLTQHPGADGEAVHPHLGRLLQPRHTSRAELSAAEGIPWAADNDCFQGLDAEAYDKMLDRLAGLGGCRFVTVPDVVRCTYCELTKDGYGGGGACACEFGPARPPLVYGDAWLTAKRFEEWAPAVERRGLPVALVLQNGIDRPSVQRWLARTWHRLDAVFVGGDDAFKLGEVAEELCRRAKADGKWVHWGRVNSRKRMRYCIGTGACDSMDGSSWAQFRDAHLDKGLAWLQELANEPVQLRLAA